MDEILQFTQMFNIDKKELGKKVPVWRFDTLNVRGVDKMTSEDVYDYFGEIHPHTVEWLSNISCNVSFDSVSTAINALIAVGRALIVSKKSGIDVPISGDDTLGLEVKGADTLEIPVPPNYRYILGCPSEKAKAIILRFATVNDIKIGEFAPKSGAGNGAMEVDVQDTIKSATNPRKVDNPLLFSNNIVLKMRADEEVEKQKTKAAARQRSDPKNVWDRLGRPPVSGRLADRLSSGPRPTSGSRGQRESVFDRLGNGAGPRSSRTSNSSSYSAPYSSRSSMGNRDSYRESDKSLRSVHAGRIQKPSRSGHIWAAENRRNIEGRLSGGGRNNRNLVVYDDDHY